ncbi:AsmA family protein [Pseudomonas chlororaphis]|uniref:AsmA family protein n=1 Tax=Pseudomonas chlororaphis TaxID=587753 RepID=UPI0007B3E1D2|nr:AsmA family protein [Pseudomonas chlororaphis]AZC48241.1 Exported protein [Pseudomonas chlororaphis subsp. piscium]AZC54818.1 Exported protein [Pseudomonas chlororaphis subsp. piscium]AZC61139.1 Exported protein [Pseudomonas chlororaphis subsp. piscium]AZC67314.1 Exported protein [Pseudomonas chlororaphis subsp. piscium]AZC73552.1 Exported protein [Pseudomonas chlororaphis subsp. piscium]
MTRTRKILAWTVGSLFLLLAVLVLIIAFFDWNRIKPPLNAKVSEELHRPFAINGNLAVIWQREPDEGGWRAWVPWPHVVAEDLTLGNPEWSKAPQMVSLKRVELRISPLALLAQRVRIPRIDLTEPNAALERLADGRANWTFQFDPKDPNAEPSNWVVDIGAIGFDKGHITLNDQSLKTRLDLLVDPLGKPIPFSDIVGDKAAKKAEEKGSAPQSYAFAFKAKGQYHGQALAGSGKIGGLLALQDASKPFPLQVQATIGDTRVELAGTLTDPLNLGALDLRMKLAGTSLGNLYPLTGVTLPDSPAYATDGHLTAQLRDPAGAKFQYQDFNGKIGDSDIHGNLTYVASQPRPKLTGALVSNQLLFSDLAPLIGADSNAEQKARGGDSKQPADKVLPVEEFRTERWRDMDADVEFTGKRIVHSADLPFTDLYTHLVLDDGRLSLEPLRFGVAGGKLDAQIRLNGQATPLEGRAKLTARNFKLKQLFPTFEPMKTSFGELNGDADIAGRGNSVAALLGSANGELKMLINDGAISRSLMEIAGLNVGNYVIGKMFGDKEVKINCAAADFGIKTGLATSRLFVFDTENAIVYIDGTANMASEQLDLTITPESKGLRLFSLRSPLYVQGKFIKPEAGVKAVPLMLRGAGMVALGVIAGPAAGLLALVAPSGGEPNQCAPLLQQMRSGKAPVAVKPTR